MTQSPNQGDIKQEKSQGISRLHKFLWDLAYHYADGPQYLKSRIESCLAQFENRQYMSLEESKDRINKEFFNKDT